MKYFDKIHGRKLFIICSRSNNSSFFIHHFLTLLKGPEMYDRVISSDLVITSGIGLIGVFSIYYNDSIFRCSYSFSCSCVFEYDCICLLFGSNKQKQKEMITDIIIMVLCTLGAIFILIASLGIYRMPDFYTRLSVTVKASTMGVGFILIAAMIYFHDFSVTTKIISIIFFLYITSPVAAFMISKQLTKEV